MKSLLPILALLLSTLVATDALSVFGGTQKALDAGGPVPGENPLTYCNAQHDDDLLVLEKVDLQPKLPEAGKPLLITATGTLLADVTQGAYVTLQVKYGLIRLLNQKVDLCEQVKGVDLECPLEKGLVEITKEVVLPKEIPPGKYHVFADAYTVDGKKIVCLEASVEFKIGG